MDHIKTYIRNSLQGIYPPGEIKNLTVMICRDLLGFSMADIYTGKDTKLSQKQGELLKSIVARLASHEPIQYIRGREEFYGMSFCVSPGVLIPRPETEELVELIVRENPHANRILDIGTGSGCIAIALSRNLPAAYVEAWDVSTNALSVARRNNEELSTNVSFYEKDVLGDVSGSHTFDIIVSNPPYVTEKERQQMDRNVLDWEPAGALFVPDDNPLLFYRRIAYLGTDLLTAGSGKLYFEINQAYGNETAGLLEHYGYRNIRVIKDLSGKNRIVTATR